MPVDANAIQDLFLKADVQSVRQLCWGDGAKLKEPLFSDRQVIVGCTQQAPLISSEIDASNVSFVNLRETGGWSSDAARSIPKQAALIAAAAETSTPPAYVNFYSKGVVLIYGRDGAAIDAANLLRDHLDLTVLLTPGAEIAAPHVTTFPIVTGRVREAKGHLGNFDLVVDAYGQSQPWSRGFLTFEPPRDGALSHCDLILDISGQPPLFPGVDLRHGYVRADAGDIEELLRAVIKMRDLVGPFDKPRYIDFNAKLCAHSRSHVVGCIRCLDLCPADAIAPSGNHVSIDTNICAGCGQCSAACPTGAVSYAFPPTADLVRKVRAMLLAYRAAGGEEPILLFHNEYHGAPLIDRLAQFGDGLPHNVLPVSVNEVPEVGLETISAALAYGASAVRLLLPANHRHDISGLHQTIAIAKPIVASCGFGEGGVATIETDDHAALSRDLKSIVASYSVPRPSSFLPIGGKRDIMHLALKELHRSSDAKVQEIFLPQGAPFGAIEIDAQGCTLCLSCVSACPTGALRDNPERPMLRFVEDACVQCGLCEATCPENVVSLLPRLNFAGTSQQPRILKEEEPFCCTRCGTPFGIRSTIDRVSRLLTGKHWMYGLDDPRIATLTMCGDCRMKSAGEAQLNQANDFSRPLPRTTDDYLREREQGRKVSGDDDD